MTSDLLVEYVWKVGLSLIGMGILTFIFFKVYRILKTKYPDIKIERDEVIAEDAQKQRGLKSGFDLPSDWLDDCND